MIISRTPLRISFVGGGSDLQSFYSRHYGAVVSTSINKYIYITLNKKFDEKIRASYSITEIVDKVSELKHQLIRESLKLLGPQNGIEVTSISDIPSQGTGLGSSSTYTVGLVNALMAYKGKLASAKYLAETACKIEIKKCKAPIGKQDQYAAAFGGLNYIRFNTDGSVEVSPVIASKEKFNYFQENLLILYTGMKRSASSVLNEQNSNIKSNRNSFSTLVKMVKLADYMKEAFSKGKIDEIGEILDENWVLKRGLASGISTPDIDEWYDSAKKAGALGGKILGAGGGGFLLLYARKKEHGKIKNRLRNLRSVDFSPETHGSKIIFVER